MIIPKKKIFIIIAAAAFIILLNIFLPKFITKTIPEIGYVSAGLADKYPNTKFNISVEKHYPKGSASTSTLQVLKSTNQNMTSTERKRLGEDVCDILAKNNINFSVVDAGQINSGGFLIFHFSKVFSEQRSCNEWFVNPPKEIMTF